MSRWWRAEDTSIDHPKLLRLSDAMHRAWYTLMCIASANNGVLPPTADIALRLREKPTKVASWIAHLVSAELFDNDDGAFRPHNWNERQYKSDVTDPTAADRNKRYRDRKRNDRNATVTMIRAEAETETNTEQSRADARPISRETELKEFLREALRNPSLAVDRVEIWFGKGYEETLIREVVAECLARKPDISSLAYFDAALSERHAKRPETPSERAEASKKIDFDKIVGLYARTQVWSKYAGPEPGHSGCKAPVDILAKHGLAPDGSKLELHS